MPAAATRPVLDFLPKGVSRGHAVRPSDERISSGNPALDRLLGGGFPRGQLTEIFGPPSSGRTSLAYGLLAAATARGEIAGLVDGYDRFDPRRAEAAGMDLTRLLWVRPGEDVQALRSAEILLGTRGFAVVVLDLADGLSAASISRFDSVWPRLARQAAAADASLVLLTRERLGGSSAALCLALRESQALWPRHRLRAPLFTGFTNRVEIVRARRALAGVSELPS
ncbi:MAG: hypothetical protein ACREQQ_01220 [Candidatus Binatia bacterium]